MCEILIEEIKQELDFQNELNQNELKVLEKIQYESLVEQNKFIEAFDKLGAFANIDFYVSYHILFIFRIIKVIRSYMTSFWLI
jgi:hypothetical protein